MYACQSAWKQFLICGGASRILFVCSRESKEDFWFSRWIQSFPSSFSSMQRTSIESPNFSQSIQKYEERNCGGSKMFLIWWPSSPFRRFLRICEIVYELPLLLTILEMTERVVLWTRKEFNLFHPKDDLIRLTSSYSLSSSRDVKKESETHGTMWVERGRGRREW